MKKLKEVIEVRAYSEAEAHECINDFRVKATENGYTAGAASFTYKTKKKNGEIISDGYLVKMTKIYNDFWEEADCE